VRKLGLKTLAFAVLYLSIVSAGISSSEPAPDIQFDETEHDFGIIGQKEEHTHVFKLRNVGKGTLNIETVRSTCGCIATLLSSKEVPPQGTAEVKVTFRSGIYEDEIRRTVYVHSDDPDEPIVKLAVKARIWSAVSLEPERLHFGKIEIGETATGKVKVYPKEKGLKITEVESSSEYLSAKLSKLTEEDKKDEEIAKDALKKNGWILEVTLSREAEIGSLYGSIRLHTNNPRNSIVSVPVQAYIIGEITLRPQVFGFGTVKKGATASREITVTKSREKTLEILKVESDLPWLLTDVKVLEKGSKYEITAKVGPDAPEGRVRGKVTIHTNNQKQPVLTALVFAYIGEQPTTEP
jgi:hypothetical protein